MSTSHCMFVLLATLFAGACAESQAAEVPPVATTSAKSNVRTSEVPHGTQLACQSLMDDEGMSELMARQVRVKQVEGSATATCALHLAGETPKSKRAKKKFADAHSGLLPSDELCQVTVECSFILDLESETARCERDGGTVKHDIGSVDCLRSFDNERYTLATLDTDTGCRFDIVAGTKLSGEASLKTLNQCASAVVGSIDSSKLH